LLSGARGVASKREKELSREYNRSVEKEVVEIEIGELKFGKFVTPIHMR